MLKTIRVLLIVAFLVLGLAACSPSTAPVPYPLSSTDTPVATVTPVPSRRPIITIDPRLILTTTPLTQTLTPAESRALATLNAPRPTPDAYCYHPPKFLLPIADAQGLNEDQIVIKLMELYLAYHHSPQAPDLCRVEEYHIDRVYYDERFATLLIEPKGDFMRRVLYSVKLPLIDTHPYSFWAVLVVPEKDQGWYQSGANVAIFRSDSGYTMKFANP